MAGLVVPGVGILSDREIAALTEAGAIRPETPYAASQIQPASLDLRLGRRAYRVRTSFLPGSSRGVAACTRTMDFEAFRLVDTVDQLSLDPARIAMRESG